ncbi:SIR2 family protein, partial [bacterium]
MILPDQSHINRIRDALWQCPESCASVMIGAGFSRNAIKAYPDAREFCLWQDLAKLLCTKLYPSGDGDRLKNAIAEASGTSGFLRLAQEYQAAFGRHALHSLIRELVPDDNYIPEDMHVRLLRLPWRDVFTTNWDTLLERSRTFVADRAYGVVRTIEEIPSAPRPRIVKLHGSFPAHVPFIFTEEDYRTYPKQFAPFVNTVQQAMMETVFCLIGFSGDDPNFLHWSGWVRDNLGELAPKIYLAGWLDLSPHRRRMLEERNVVPIDLAQHPQADSWPDHLRHRYATDWILHTLERGRPYEITEWPFPPDWTKSPIPKLLQPVEDVTVNAPLKEPLPPGLNTEPTGLLSQVRAIIDVWRHNRNVYPRWLFIPPTKHLRFRMSLDRWEQVILRTIPEFPLLEKLSIIRELVWLRENLLEPLSEPLEVAVQTILKEFDCKTRKMNDPVDCSVRWVDIREIWRDMGMALLTAARQRFNRDIFDRLLLNLQPFMDDNPDVAQRINHEKCLWALYSLDFAGLEKLLKEWQTEGCDPIWMARKAAILIETDRNEEAVRLLNRSLSIVREAPQDSLTLASPSREGWILWLALAFEQRFGASTDETLDAPPAFKRWRQLANFECDAFSQKRDIFNTLRGDPKKKDIPLFDLGARRGKTIHLENKKYEGWIFARRAVRLCEVAGLPPSASHMVVASDLLKIAADHLIDNDYALAFRIALRVSTSEDDETFNRVWSRTRIAVLPIEEVATLVELVTSVINYALPRAISHTKKSVFWLTRLRVAIEALSRLVLRLTPEKAEDIFNLGLGYYRTEGVAKRSWLYKVMDNLLARSWETLPKNVRSGLVLKVLSAPISGLDGFDAFQFYPDTGGLLVNDDEIPAPIRTSETEASWAEIVQMIIRGLRSTGEARKRAAVRLVPLTLWGSLTRFEQDLVAQALWQASDNLPLGTSLNDWMFILLPEPEPGIAEQRFRKKWLGSQELKDGKKINEFFWYVGTAIEGLKNHNRPLILSEDESNN